MAFITSAGFNTVAHKQSALCHSAAVQRSGRKAVIRAARDLKEETKFEAIEANKISAKNAADVEPQGFTPYAELVNGRMAMLGFTLALLTECISPAHPTLLKQLYTLIPLQPLLEKIFN